MSRMIWKDSSLLGRLVQYIHTLIAYYCYYLPHVSQTLTFSTEPRFLVICTITHVSSPQP